MRKDFSPKSIRLTALIKTVFLWQTDLCGFRGPRYEKGVTLGTPHDDTLVLAMFVAVMVVLVPGGAYRQYFGAMVALLFCLQNYDL